MPSDNSNQAKSAAVAAARHARAEGAAAMRTAMSVGRQQRAKSAAPEASTGHWVTAILVVGVVLGMLIAVLAFAR